MTVLGIWLNSAFKSVPGSWIWWKLKAVMKLLSQNYREFSPPCWHWEWMFSFSPFLVLLGIGFIFGQFLKGIPVLKSSEPQLSPGHNHFLFTLIFWNVMKKFTVFFSVSNKYFCLWDTNFENFITPMIFCQNQLSGTVLNAELQGLFKTGIGIKNWLRFDEDMTTWSHRGI